MFPYLFVDGQFVSPDEARVSTSANALSYGTGTFEGIRAFRNARGEVSLLAPREHFERMHRSARILGLELRYSSDELVDICTQLLQRNDVREDAYLRPLLVLTAETLQVRMHELESRLSIAVTPMGLNYINPKGVRCMVSSWRRTPDVAMPNRAKVVGGYVGPALAKTEAMRCGFEEAIMLTMDGHVAEATTSNVFLRFGDVWVTPPPHDDILAGITRGQLFMLIDEVLAEKALERSVDRSELYAADEVLLCGTAALVVPVVSVDGRPVGDGTAGDRSKALQQALLAIARGEGSRHVDWVTPVEYPVSAHVRSFA